MGSIVSSVWPKPTLFSYYQKGEYTKLLDLLRQKTPLPEINTESVFGFPLLTAMILLTEQTFTFRRYPQYLALDLVQGHYQATEEIVRALIEHPSTRVSGICSALRTDGQTTKLILPIIAAAESLDLNFCRHIMSNPTFELHPIGFDGIIRATIEAAIWNLDKHAYDAYAGVTELNVKFINTFDRVCNIIRFVHFEWIPKAVCPYIGTALLLCRKRECSVSPTNLSKDLFLYKLLPAILESSSRYPPETLYVPKSMGWMSSPTSCVDLVLFTSEEDEKKNPDK